MISRYSKIAVTMSFFVVLVITLHYAEVILPIERTIRRVLYPIARSVLNTDENHVDEDLAGLDRDTLANMYTKLEGLYADKVVDGTQCSLALEENIQLREQLSFIASARYVTVGATIISSTVDSVNRGLIVDRGTNDGVSIGNPVIVGRGVLIGSIIEVQEKSAIIRLLTDTRSRVAAGVMNQERSIGIVEGGFGLGIELNLVPQNEFIQIGDIIMTSGLEERIPRGLIIGTVDSIEKEPFQPFQRATIHPMINPLVLSVVSVITTTL